MKLYIYIILIYVITTTSCRKFVEVDPPNNLITTGNVYNSDETAIAALTNIYAKIQNELNVPYNMAFYTGMYGDELKNNTTNTALTQMYTNSLKATDGGWFDNLWQKSYSYIFQANSVIEGCTSSKNINTDVKVRLIAEARFIRAWLYFNLINIYGDLPLITTTDYSTNGTIEKSATTVVYAQIISNLQAAESAFATNYVALNSVTSTTDRVRPNKAAASALLARVFLYSGDFKGAETEATKVIENTALYSLPAVDKNFLKSGNEGIWQIQMPTPIITTNNTYEGQNFILTAKPGNGANNSSTISDQLLAAFESGDLRKTNWIGKYTDVSVTPNVLYYFPNKYKTKNASSVSEYTTPLRLGEQYLVRAEARARQNNLTMAAVDLNVIRARAGLKDTTSSDQATLLRIIWHEKQVELFCEYGHRWFDLKRTGTVDAVMTTVSATKGGSWAAYKQFWPIYYKDVLANPYLTQNQGYN